VSAITALALPAMILAAGLVTDAGMVIWVKACAQSAADLAALAAVQEIDLDKLALGERWLVEPIALERAVSVARDNLARGGEALDADNAVVRVLVFNMKEGETVFHPGDRRPLRDPTVCVTIEVKARLPFLSPIKVLGAVFAHADASVVERRR